MSDIEEPPSKITKVEEPYSAGSADEGQEEWLSEGLLTDDDYNPADVSTEYEDNDMTLNNATNDVTMPVMQALRTDRQKTKTLSEKSEHNSVETIEDTLNNLDNASTNNPRTDNPLPEDLDEFLVKKTHIFRADEDKHSENSTDDLLRILGEGSDTVKDSKKKASIRHVDPEATTDDEEDDLTDYQEKVKPSALGKNSIANKTPSRALPEDMDDSDTDKITSSLRNAKNNIANKTPRKGLSEGTSDTEKSKPSTLNIAKNKMAKKVLSGDSDTEKTRRNSLRIAKNSIANKTASKALPEDKTDTDTSMNESNASRTSTIRGKSSSEKTPLKTATKSRNFAIKRVTKSSLHQKALTNSNSKIGKSDYTIDTVENPKHTLKFQPNKIDLKKVTPDKRKENNTSLNSIQRIIGNKNVSINLVPVNVKFDDLLDRKDVLETSVESAKTETVSREKFTRSKAQAEKNANNNKKIKNDKIKTIKGLEDVVDEKLKKTKVITKLRRKTDVEESKMQMEKTKPKRILSDKNAPSSISKTPKLKEPKYQAAKMTPNKILKTKSESEMLFKKSIAKTVAQKLKAPKVEKFNSSTDCDDLFEDDFGILDELEDGEIENKSTGQRIMKPEVMDEDYLSDSESDTDDMSLFEELPSSESDNESEDWFQLDIRSETAGDYLPMLGSKAYDMLSEEKERMTDRLVELRKSLADLTDSGKTQADELKKATLQLAELDSMLAAT